METIIVPKEMEVMHLWKETNLSNNEKPGISLSWVQVILPLCNRQVYSHLYKKQPRVFSTILGSHSI